jgi:hypothetical protein
LYLANKVFSFDVNLSYNLQVHNHDLQIKSKILLFKITKKSNPIDDYLINQDKFIHNSISLLNNHINIVQ